VADNPERWTRATVYPDMWVDPGDDPRNTDGVSPDGELATLQDYLKDYRLTLQMKCDGMDPEQLARRAVPPSTMSLLGLLRHLAECERAWRSWVLPADPEPKLYGARDGAFDGAVAEHALVEVHSRTWPVSRRQQTRCWPGIRIWARGWVRKASPCVSCGCTGSRSMPGTAGTPICCANASMAG
jgi:hypothetical protein